MGWLHRTQVTKKINLQKKKKKVDSCFSSKDLGNTKFLMLNTTDGAQTESGNWNDTTPTSSVISIGTDNITLGDAIASVPDAISWNNEVFTTPTDVTIGTDTQAAPPQAD